MNTIAVLAPFVLLGVGVLFIAFSGGPSALREAYLTRGGRAFRALMVLVAIVGIGVPALVLANRQEAAGGSGALRSKELSFNAETGKLLFRQRCASCHSLAAVNARGVTGPNLDDIGEVTPDRIEDAIRNGGTGQERMPAGLLEGEDARAVAEYVSQVAGR
jgi:mono/diheme cytochrome c family protein